MSTLVQRMRFRISRFLAPGNIAAIACLLLLAAAQPASAQSAIFAASKNICTGVPGQTDPNNCNLSAVVAAGQPVFYVIKITNPFGSPSQQMNLTEHYPTGFMPGAITCTDQLGNPVPTASVGSNIGPFTLPANSTVTCTIAGSFSMGMSGSKANNVDVSNGTTTQTVGVTTSVAATAPLNADLSVTKSVSPTSIGPSLPANVTYTITIANNGPTAVNVGDYFVLHDALSLLPNSVPLNATFVSASCASLPLTTDCLSSSGPTVTGGGLIGTMAPHPVFDWGFAPGTGHIDVGGTIKLTITVKIATIPFLSCIKQQNSDGLNNQTFFTLIDSANGNAESDINGVNDSASAPLVVHTGNTHVDPNCGSAQLTMTKVQVAPSPNNIVAWGPPPPPGAGNVGYDITITNSSVPAQPITIAGGNLQDYVNEGVGTPPFTRTFVGEAPIPGTPPPPVPSATGFHYTFYDETNLGWKSRPNAPVTLAPNQSIGLHIEFNYSNPDCETVPNVPLRTITNIAQVTYQATPVGASSSSAPKIWFTQTAKARTLMQPQQPCKFAVTKKLVSGGPLVQFGGPPLVYVVSYTNNDAPRTIGTILDAVRLTNPAYATQVPFTASWACSSSSGVSGFTPSGSVASGEAIYTPSPAQGTIVMQQPPNTSNPNGAVFFPHNSNLTCLITIFVKRPLYNNPHCTMLPSDFENAALMDVTHPFNSSVPWPPSSTYNSTSTSNPPERATNWATVQTPLPKCFSAVINKSASVNGLPPGSPAWTYAGGPLVNYTITVTNTGSSTLNGTGNLSNWNGLLVTDNFTPLPYTTNLVSLTTSNCPGTWCATLQPTSTPHASPSFAGVANLAGGGSGNWGLTLQAAYLTNTVIQNCAGVSASGSLATPAYYPNYDPSDPPKACASVPVLDTRPLNVTKTVVNQTGAAIALSALPFSANVVCGQFQLPPENATLTTAAGTVPNGASTTSSAWTIQNVPVSDQCTVTEASMPAVPAAAMQACPSGVAVWVATPVQPITIAASGVNVVTLVNTLQCNVITTGSLTLLKTADYDGQIIAGHPLTFPIKLDCTLPNGSTTTQIVSIAVNNNGTFQQTVSGILVGSQCTITEQPATYGSTALANFWATASANCPWHTTYPFGQQVTIQSATQTLQIVNEEMCSPGIPPAGFNTVQEEKTPIVNGVVTYTPGVGFPIAVICTMPNGQIQDDSWTAIAGSTFMSQVTVPTNTTCTWTETPPALPLGTNSACYWQTNYYYNGSPVSAGQSIPITTPPSGHPYNWVNIQNQLICPNGPVVVIPPVALMVHPNGGQGTVRSAPQCVPSAVPGTTQTNCTCPDGEKLNKGKCEKKKSSFFDNLHIEVGVGIGVGGGGHDGKGNKSKKCDPNGPVPCQP